MYASTWSSTADIPAQANIFAQQQMAHAQNMLNQWPQSQMGQGLDQFAQYTQGRTQQNNVGPQITTPKEKKSMFKEIATDIKGFILEHRGVIYFIAFALMLDHFFFRGAFKTRLQGMADRIVSKVEEKIK